MQPNDNAWESDQLFSFDDVDAHYWNKLWDLRPMRRVLTRNEPTSGLNRILDEPLASPLQERPDVAADPYVELPYIRFRVENPLSTKRESAAKGKRLESRILSPQN